MNVMVKGVLCSVYYYATRPLSPEASIGSNIHKQTTTNTHIRMNSKLDKQVEGDESKMQ
jgi:hypothetical protein